MPRVNKSPTNQILTSKFNKIWIILPHQWGSLFPTDFPHFSIIIFESLYSAKINQRSKFSHKVAFILFKFSLPFQLWIKNVAFNLSARCDSVLMPSCVDCSTQDSISLSALVLTCCILAVSNLSWYTIRALFSLSCIMWTKLKDTERESKSAS